MRVTFLDDGLGIGFPRSTTGAVAIVPASIRIAGFLTGLADSGFGVGGGTGSGLKLLWCVLIWKIIMIYAMML